MEISRQPCPNCSSSNAYSFNTIKGVGRCFSCSKSSHVNPADSFYEAERNPPVEPKDTHPAQEGTYKEHRGVTEATMELYGVKDYGGRHTYVYPSGASKTRYYPTKNFSAKGSTSKELFGTDRFPQGSSKKVTITEGELDAMSAHQMLNDGKWTYPVVSLPSATPSNDLWPNVREYLSSFETIVLCIEYDGPGNEIAEKINRMFPSRVVRMDFHNGYKDANEMLEAGRSKEFKNLWWGAKRIIPNNINASYEDFVGLFESETKGVFVPTGIPELDAVILGWAEGHYTLLKAKTGIGKTELVRFIEHTFITEGVPFGSWHLEETQLRSLLGLVTYDLEHNVTRKDLITDQGLEDVVKESIKGISEKELYYQFSMNEDCSAQDVIDQIRFMREAFGCRFIIMEPVQDILNISGDESKESILAEFAIRISKIAADTGVGIIMVAHTNDDDQIKYCRMLGQRASVVINMKRDKDAENEVDKNTTELFVEKNRPTSLEGHAGSIYFNRDTFTIKPL
jgi:twinkle protein